jgi:hypothetical protein
MNNKLVLIILIIIIVFIFNNNINNNKRAEHLTDHIDVEALENLLSLYKSGELMISNLEVDNNLKITGNLNNKKDITYQGKSTTNNNMNVNKKLTINDVVTSKNIKCNDIKMNKGLLQNAQMSGQVKLHNGWSLFVNDTNKELYIGGYNKKARDSSKHIDMKDIDINVTGNMFLANTKIQLQKYYGLYLGIALDSDKGQRTDKCYSNDRWAVWSDNSSYIDIDSR